MPSQSSVQELQQPTSVKDALALQQRDYDCTSCRVMGSVVFTGMGIYSYASGMRQLREREREILRSGSRFGLGARKGAIYALSASLVGLGVYRLQN
ncbi:hypothetical protein LTR91_001736 [Friedmanniomyces endolithicus]|uniref:Distal membrane-arm assembly complex protein 1-like domain-containing protein n=1 Tax=Friedmanniomyces endolithicus TaxID=329885 RepID=A0AAN6FUX7_9PEZI|nr:hypothetical protein LTR35_003911 [Friedmanniomyces endolithicus]KAK0300271.1 hypothetical protein LTS00_001343 [Friedmanniomyces endolithicus]KAK0314777.1 hypothetical protein LTR01_001601 [Friedmanniomyces endolithicus]KAK0324928.1 hypothetical protein LTR82_003914 [Friedmanniomyces endolithicus]KAK0831023.1 hypothetical protein LTR73_003410 [Friedmanniomyces endolithicus]